MNNTADKTIQMPKLVQLIHVSLILSFKQMELVKVAIHIKFRNMIKRVATNQHVSPQRRYYQMENVRNVNLTRFH